MPGSAASIAQAADVKAYILGMQAVIWSMLGVKGGRALYDFSAPLPSGTARSPIDLRAHGINVWGYARALLTARCG